MAERLLPDGFEALESFHDYWGVPGSQQRRELREALTMPEIMPFYEACLAHAPAAMKHLEAFRVDAMPPAEARLYELILALAHVSMATELHGQPRAPNTPYPHNVRLVEGPACFG
jgi:hypothetical protein